MRRIAKVSLFMVLAVLFSVQFCLGQGTISSTDKEVIQWLRQNSHAIEHVKAESGFLDLAPLKKSLENVKVVGLGENTHGTKEFFQLKHRLLEFLVIELGFQALAIEGSYASSVPINDYILNGKGNLDDVLTGQGFVVWDTEEFATMINWMYNYNQKVPDRKKVQFYGLDYAYNLPGGKKVLKYIQRYKVGNVPAMDTVLKTISTLEETNWPFRMEKAQEELQASLPLLEKVINALTKNKKNLIDSSSPKEYRQALMYAQTMRQWFVNNITDSIPEASTGNMVRSVSMAKNLFNIMANQQDLEKVVIWEHNVHVSVGEPESGEANLGHEIRSKYGEEYYSIGFEFNQGSYQSRVLGPDGSLGKLNSDEVDIAPEGYLAWYLSESKMGDAFLHLKADVANKDIKEWLNMPQTFRSYSWISDKGSIKKVHLENRFDGLIFIENTTATTPTKNALKSIAQGKGL